MADHECHLIAKLLKALEPFASTTITDSGQIIGLMREDFKRASSVITEARAAIAKATGEDARLIAKMGWLPPEEAGALKAQVAGARITSGAVSEGGDHD